MAKVKTEGQAEINKAKESEGDGRVFLAKEIACAKSPRKESKIWKLFKIN